MVGSFSLDSMAINGEQQKIRNSSDSNANTTDRISTVATAAAHITKWSGKKIESLASLMCWLVNNKYIPFYIDLEMFKRIQVLSSFPVRVYPFFLLLHAHRLFCCCCILIFILSFQMSEWILNSEFWIKTIEKCLKKRKSFFIL